MVQDQSRSSNQVFIDWDDCCDHERITIQEVDGKFKVEKELREQFRSSPCSCIEEESSISSWKSWVYRRLVCKH